jgi:hypothetical protein
MDSDNQPLDPPEPRWPAVIAVLATGGIYLALPASLAVGPRWLQPAVVLILIVPTVITYRRGQHALNQLLGHALAAGVTLFMVWSLVLLVLAVPAHKESPGDKVDTDGAAWSPEFVDYLFLAFNTSTAFSPTDSPILSRWAKLLTMLQSMISLIVVIVLAARAVNIL